MMTHLPSTLDAIPILHDTAISVGSYDGVHRGHLSMIDHLRREAASRGLRTALITFQPHHRIFFRREAKPFLLTDLEEKLLLLERTGIDHAIVLPFTADLAAMSAATFMERVLRDRLGARLFIVGHDQAIGRDQLRGPERIGDPARALGIEVASVGPLMDEGEPVSSTRIREALRAGELARATALLGYPYLLTGTVVRGTARGRSLGYPTANLAPAEPLKLVPAPGVYVATADLPMGEAGAAARLHQTAPPLAAARLRGLVYIGSRPTFGETDEVIELFLMDYERELYGAKVQASVLERLRGDVRFASADELVGQMRQDEARARRYFLRA